MIHWSICAAQGEMSYPSLEVLTLSLPVMWKSTGVVGIGLGLSASRVVPILVTRANTAGTSLQETHLNYKLDRSDNTIVYDTTHLCGHQKKKNLWSSIILPSSSRITCDKVICIKYLKNLYRQIRHHQEIPHFTVCVWGGGCVIAVRIFIHSKKDKCHKKIGTIRENNENESQWNRTDIMPAHLQ